MNKAIKYRLYPTTEQRTMFAKTFGCCRKIWNLMLADKIEAYEKTGEFSKPKPADFKKEYPYLKEVDSLALCNVQLNLNAAFKNHYDNKRKKKNGFPKFKSEKRSKKSYKTNNQEDTIIIFEDGFIKLPKIGKVKAKIHRIPNEEWKLKSATISQASDGTYYASVLFEYKETENRYKINESNVIGLDYASDGLYVDNNGNVGSYHKYYKKSHKKLAKAQRKLSKKVGSKKKETKSKNYLKQLRKVNKIHCHIANQRRDSLHKKSTEIANQYDIVCVETLNMKAMSNKKFGNGKATLDNGYGEFLNMLEYKLNDRHKHLIRVDKWYPSSQLCSKCGKQHKEMKNLSNRKFECDCGLSISRDQNAAINIKNEGLRLLKEAA